MITSSKFPWGWSSKMKSKTQRFILLASSLALVLSACSVLLPDFVQLVPGRVGVFPHDVHMGEEVESDCVDCHITAEDEDAASMPTMRGCLSCHDEETDAGKEFAQTPAAFVLEGEKKPTWTSITAQPVECDFSHAAHYEAELDCEDCHQGVSGMSNMSRGLAVRMETCVECHEKDNIDDGGCEGCHSGVTEEWAPPTHDAFWDRTHGHVVVGDGECADSARNDCSLCHEQTECSSCHLNNAPMDHSESWRTRGHGFTASLDRNRCMTCHREDSCVRCHMESEPVTHGGFWGGDTSAHCGSCHLPLGADDGCFACHRNTVSHLTAGSIPGGGHPNSSSDCRSCHFPLDHFDNGQDCTICHR